MSCFGTQLRYVVIYTHTVPRESLFIGDDTHSTAPRGALRLSRSGCVCDGIEILSRPCQPLNTCGVCLSDSTERVEVFAVVDIVITAVPFDFLCTV